MWHLLKRAWRNLTHRRAVDDELSDEIRSYQTMLEDEKIRAGVDPTAARRQALTSEIGLRVALGASRSNILGMTIAQGMRPAVLGIVLGAIGASWLTRYADALLFAVKPFDLLTYGAVAILLLGTALLACYLPGLRAMRTDPVVALRAE